MFAVTATVIGCGKDTGRASGTNDCVPIKPLAVTAHIERRIPHDSTSYTQGLVIHRDQSGKAVIFESSGLYGKSKLSTLDLSDGSVIDSVALAPELFGEGIALVEAPEDSKSNGEPELVQLTWKEGVALRWNANGFTSQSQPSGEFTFNGEGWGLTTLDSGRLLMSDGTDRLVERDPRTFKVLATHQVKRSDGFADMLNELEWDGRWLWANRYQTNEIVRIDTKCWNVTGVLDASDLRAEVLESAERTGGQIDVLNGIAFDKANDTYLVTGKLWPIMFEVSFAQPE